MPATDIHFWPPVDWRETTDDDPDDEQIETPTDVVEILGFDPAETEPPEPRLYQRLSTEVIRYLKANHPEYYARHKPMAGQRSLFGGVEAEPHEGEKRTNPQSGHTLTFRDHRWHLDEPKPLPKPTTTQGQTNEPERTEPQPTVAAATTADVPRQPDDREPDRPSDSGADRVRSPDERIVVARGRYTPPADRSRVPESVRQHLRDHQIEGVAAALASMEVHGGHLNCDGTGVGKTRQQLAVARFYLDKGKRVVVIAPKGVTKADWKKGTVTGSWKDDSEAMGIPLHVTRDTILPEVVNISSYENLGKLKKQVDDNTVVIIDESHNLKNYTSARSKHGTEMADKAHAVLYATATPVDKVEHLHYLDRAGAFGGQYYGKTYEKLGLHQVDQHVGGGRYVKKWEIKPGVKAAEVMRRMSGLFDRLTADGKMLKREISMEGVPVAVEQIKLPPEAHEVMARIERDLSGSSANPGSERARILMHQRRQQEPYKVKPTVELAKAALEQGRQVVIFASRVNESTVGDEDDEDAVTSEGTMKLLREELESQGVNPEHIAEIHGGISKAKIPKEMDRFQSGAAKVVIATLQSGGVGINLDDTTGAAPRTLLMMTAPFSAVENVQGIGRVWRLNTKSTPDIKFLFADTEVDDWNAALIAKKMKTLGASVMGQIATMDVSRLDEAAIDYEPDDPYEWKYPGEGEPSSATFSRLPSGEWGVRVEGSVNPGDVVQVTKRDGSTQHKTVGRIVSSGKGFVTASISDKPVIPTRDLPPPAPPESPPKTISDEKKGVILASIRQIASMDSDRAAERNNVGFNKFDGEFGHQLAAQEELTDRQAEAAEKLVNKYKRQLDPGLAEAATKQEPQPDPEPEPTRPNPSSNPFESLATWSAPKKVNTKQGDRFVRSAHPTESFWGAWRKNKEKLKAAGISVSKYQGEWQVSWWNATDKYRRWVESLKYARKYNQK